MKHHSFEKNQHCFIKDGSSGDERVMKPLCRNDTFFIVGLRYTDLQEKKRPFFQHVCINVSLYEVAGQVPIMRHHTKLIWFIKK